MDRDPDRDPDRADGRHDRDGAGRRGQPGRGRGSARRRRHRPPVLLGVHVPGRCRRRRHASPSRRPTRPARPQRSRRDPQLVGARADGQAGRDSRPHERAQLHGLEDRRRSRVSAPSSAACSTRSCAPPSRSSPRPSSTPGSRSRREHRPPARPSSAGRRGKGFARNATGSTARAATARRSQATRCSPTSEALANLLAEGATRPTSTATCRRSRPGWPDGQLQALIDYLAATPGLAGRRAGEGS